MSLTSRTRVEGCKSEGDFDCALYRRWTDKNAAEALQEQIKDHIRSNHGDEIEWFFSKRTFTPKITKKSVNRWETIRAVAG